MSFYRITLRIPWTKSVSNKEHLREKADEISGTHNERRRFGTFNIHRAYRTKRGGNLPNELVEMNGRTGSGRDSKMLNIVINYKGKEILESHVHPHPQRDT